MLTKFETRSNRVKGASFHPKRSWVLCGLHNGTVQIWDYRMGTSIDRYEEHEGPVRGVDFHPEQPLFASGGDDYKIKLWNYKLRRCLFTMQGHLDYIRTIQFHKEQPWLLSASDDQTVRIWNWQSRSCISVLTGHNHYVMSAQFHPTEDLIVSASLDLTIRVWDISGLRARKPENSMQLPQDLFGSNDVAIRFILEGHEKGVNWASFHPTKPYIVSGADDRSIRVWKMDDTRTYEVEQLRGHTNNVSSVMYFKDFIVSNSEDRTIRVWDLGMRAAVQTFRRDMDRFWILNVHPTNNLLVAGHDTGMIVFKLERERPAFTIRGNALYWVRERTLRCYDFDAKSDSTIATLRRHSTPAMTMSCNPADNTAVLWYDYDGGVFEAFNIPKGGFLDSDFKKGFYTSAVFFGANKFAVLDKTRQIVLRTTSNEIAKVLPPVQETNRLFYAPQGHLICRSPTKICMFHVAQRAVVAECAAANVKYVVWDRDFNKVALQSKEAITVANRKLKILTTVTETVRIKSCCFDSEREVMFYTTSNHIKYCNLRSGECGIVKTLPDPIYLIRAENDRIWYITRDGRVVDAAVDNKELAFKLALHQEKYREVLKLIQSRKLHGKALVAYLHKHGHPDIALHFVSDPMTKFNLALECGAMDIAKQTALELNDVNCWRRLAETAPTFGDIQLAQLANVKIQNYHGLGMQCVLTGNMSALSQMIRKSQDEHFQMHYSMYTGDVEQRVEMLVNCGQLPLAYSLAKSYGEEEMAAAVFEKMSPEVQERMKAYRVNPVRPKDQPAQVPDNWPLLPVQESYFTRMLKEPGLLDIVPEPHEEGAGGGAATWGEDELDLGEEGEEGLPAEAKPTDEAAALGVPEQGAGEWDDDLDIDVSMLPASAVAAAATGKGTGFIMPREGESLQKHWIDFSQLAAHHVAAGAFASAMELLKRQIGLVDPQPLMPLFMQIWASCNGSMPSWSAVPPHNFCCSILPAATEYRGKHAPMIPPFLPTLKEKIKQGYQATTEGRFPDAHKIFESILHLLIFTVVEEKEAGEIFEILQVAREYVMALNVELTRKNDTKDVSRTVELACYFTHFKLQNSHLILSLSQAMTLSFKAKNFKTACGIAKRLLDMDPPADRADKARKVVALCEQNMTDAVKINYDDRNPFTLCSVSKQPMYRGTVDPIRCSFCYSPCNPKFKGDKCPVCHVGGMGLACAGMVSGLFQSK